MKKNNEVLRAFKIIIKNKLIMFVNAVVIYVKNKLLRAEKWKIPWTWLNHWTEIIFFSTGISLPMDQWKRFKEQINEIDDAIREMS